MFSFLLLIPMILLAIGIFNAALPAVVGNIVNATNMPQNIYSLLIEVPRPFWNDTVYGMPALANSTTGGIYSPSGYSGIIGPSMTNFYAGSRYAAFALLAFVLIIAAFSFFLQNFRLVGEGTAMRILTGTVMVAVLIYIFPAIYDVIAAAVNSVTCSIASPNTIYTILNQAAAITPNPGSVTTTTNASTGITANITNPPWAAYMGNIPGATSSSYDVGSAIAGIIMNLFLLIFVMITYVSIAIMGILRTFFIGAAFALMPVLLVMRLMPYIDKVADLFIQVIVGGILASVIVSVFFAFGYDVLTNASISGLMKTLIAMGVLLASSMMMTVLIPHLGSLMSSVSTAITGAATGAVVGGAAVTTGAATAGAQALPGLMTGVETGALSPAKAVLMGAGTTAVGGLGTFGAVAPRLVPGMGAAGYAIPTAVSMGKGVGGMDFVQRYAASNPEYADALLLQAAATPHENEGDPGGMAEYAENVKTDLLTRPPEVLGREYETMTGTKLNAEESAEVGKRMQGRVRQIMDMTKDDKGAQNVLLSRIGRGYNAWKAHTVELKPKKVKATEEAAVEEAMKRSKGYYEEAGTEHVELRLEEAGLTGLSPITKSAALRDRKANADKVAEFVQRRKGVEG